MRLEGSRILARVTGDTASFTRVLKQLPDMLTAVAGAIPTHYER